jgi:hypothetical protein
MKTSTIVKSLNVLIIITIIITIGAVAAVAMTIAQSAPYVSIGQVSQNMTGTVARIDIPVTIGNRGYLAFADINARLSLKDSNGTTLVEGSGGPLTIPAGSTSTFVLTITIDTAHVTPEVLQDLMTNSQNLTVNASLGGAIPPMVSLAASASGNFYWGAPFKNLQMGSPTFITYNSTHLLTMIPVSFDNDSPYFPVSGQGSVRVLDANGQQVGSGKIDINAPTNSHFSGNLQIYFVMPTTLTESLLLNDTTLNFNALIELPSFGMGALTLPYPLTFEWGAPIKDLTVGNLQTTAYNATHARVTLPFSFKDNSAFLPVQGALTSTILLINGTEVGTGDSYILNVSPGTTLSDNLTGYMKNEAVGQTSYILRLNFQTAYGSVIEEVTLHA